MMKNLLRSAGMAALAIAAFGVTPGLAATPTLPTGGTFSAGTGTISTSGSTETVTVSNPGAIGAEPGIIDWNSFSVGAGGTISYVPAAGAPTSGVIVNVDKSGSMSVINGTVSSPQYAQVIVNPAGISVGATASLPAQTELAAGTFNNGYGSGPTVDTIPVTITADAAPITIAKGATFAALSTSTPAVLYGVDTVASTGDTLPDSVGMLTDVLVPANAASSFTLQPGQTGDLSFIGAPSGIDNTTGNQIPTAPSAISITGPSGGKVGTIQYDEPFQTDPTTGTRLPTGTMSVSNVISTGSMFFGSGQDVTLSGVIEAAAGLSADAETFTGPDATQPPGSGTTPTLSIAPGVKLGCGAGVCSLYGTTVSIGSGVSMTGNGGISANRSISSSSSSPAQISVNGNFGFAAPSVSNLSIIANGANDSIDVQANSFSSSSISASYVSVLPADYELNAPDYKPMSIDNVSISTGNLQIDGAYGVALNNVHQTLPAGSATGSITISGANSSGGYSASANGSNAVSLSNSSLDAGWGGSINVSAGIASGSANPPALPGSISINGSTLKTAGGKTIVTAYDGGSIDVGSGSTLSANEAAACDGTYAGCATAILAQTVDFKAGNAEKASGADLFSASSKTGTANAAPAEVATSPGGAFGNIEVVAPGGAVAVSGTLDAGAASGAPTPPPPSVAPPPPAAAPQPKAAPAPRPVIPAVTIQPITIRPSGAVDTVQQRGSTVLVPEAGAAAAEPEVNIGYSPATMAITTAPSGKKRGGK